LDRPCGDAPLRAFAGRCHFSAFVGHPERAQKISGLSVPTILKSAFGQPFNEKSLTARMASWTKAAGLPSGCTLHGLRKTDRQCGRLADHALPNFIRGDYDTGQYEKA
jgi:hypothetical protein